jgi:transposase
MLMPPDLAKGLPEDHLVYFIREVIGRLNLCAFNETYDGSKGGYPAYHPEMMVALLLYAYWVGVPSSRQIEKASKEPIPFRVLTANPHPDHDSQSQAMVASQVTQEANDKRAIATVGQASESESLSAYQFRI